MVSPKPFFSTTIAERIKQLKRRGSATIATVQDPVTPITLNRQGSFATGGWAEVVTFTPIRIRLDSPSVMPGALNTGTEERELRGTFLAWAPLDCRADDHFTWQDRLCVVDGSPFERYGVVEVPFRVLETPTGGA